MTAKAKARYTCKTNSTVKHSDLTTTATAM